MFVIQYGGNNWKGYYKHVTRKHDESRIESGLFKRNNLGQLKEEILTRLWVKGKESGWELHNTDVIKDFKEAKGIHGRQCDRNITDRT